MYSTASFVPAIAYCGGRYDMRMCLPTDGPAPALVTYERRPFASVSGAPSRSTIGSRPSGYRLTPLFDVWSSIVSVQSIAGGLALAMRHVRRFADEVLFLHLPPRHVGLDDVVVSVELGAERAVRLLEPPGRAVDADPRGDDAVRLAPPPRARPTASRRPPSRRRSPSRGRRRRRSATRTREPVQVEQLPGAEREALVRDVAARDRRKDVARARPPQPDRALLRGVVVDARPVGSGGRRTTSCRPSRVRRR